MRCRQVYGWKRTDTAICPVLQAHPDRGRCLALSPFAAYVIPQRSHCRRQVLGNNYDIILIGLVAVFLILRLRSVLGKRTGSERPPARDPFTPPTPPSAPPRIGSDAPSGNDNVVPMPAPSPRTSQPTSGP